MVGYHGEGPHPLEGVPNYQELPAPEPLGKVPGLEPSDVQVNKVDNQASA